MIDRRHRRPPGFRVEASLATLSTNPTVCFTLHPVAAWMVGCLGNWLDSRGGAKGCSTHANNDSAEAAVAVALDFASERTRGAKRGGGCRSNDHSAVACLAAVTTPMLHKPHLWAADAN